MELREGMVVCKISSEFLLGTSLSCLFLAACLFHRLASVLTDRA
jgi:hypothetical protein